MASFREPSKDEVKGLGFRDRRPLAIKTIKMREV